MEDIKVGYISAGQTVKIENKTLKVNEIIKRNKFGLIIGGISIILLSIYAVLIYNFINLITILN